MNQMELYESYRQAQAQLYPTPKVGDKITYTASKTGWRKIWAIICGKSVTEIKEYICTHTLTM